MSGGYYVHFVESETPMVYGPFALKSAKDYARIGSQYGSRRMVTRGKDGLAVRLYERGHRKWPYGAEQLAVAGLAKSERPKVVSPRLPPSLRRAWAEQVEMEGASMTQNPAWSKHDTKLLVRYMASYIWMNALYRATNDPWVIDNLGHDIPKSAEVDARRYLRAIKYASDKHPWWEVANSNDLRDLMDIAQLIVAKVEHEKLEEPMNANDAALRRVAKLARRTSVWQ